MNGFISLGLSDETLAALERKGFSTPTPIQAGTIPLLMRGDRDVVGQARTGTGKTAAFGLPIIERAKPDAGFVQALILVPTRELAGQVATEIRSLKGTKRISVQAVYGGQAMGPQIRSLKRGADVVAGTPGRVLDLLERGVLRLDRISYLVLDEADEMCDMGFVDDVRAILAQAAPERRTLLFSATMPQEVLGIAAEFMGDYELVAAKDEGGEKSLTEQVFHEVAETDRFEALCRIIDVHPDFYGLVFCRTKIDTDQVAERLAERGYPAEPIHGDLSQARREEILGRFKRRRLSILVATDVAARGIDVPDLTHVVNFALPQAPETYVHRVGRTGRAGKRGTAVTIIAPHEFRKLMFISRATGLSLEKRRLPRAHEVVDAKRTRIMAAIAGILEEGGHAPYLELARDLLGENDPVEVAAAILRQAHGEELDAARYRDIDERNNKPGQARGPHDRVRLRAALGRTQGMTPRKFVEFVCRNARIHPRAIQNVRVLADHSVFTAPSDECADILKSLNRRSKGRHPLVRRG